MLTLPDQSESSKSALPSFWVPSLTPNTDANEIAASKAVKLAPICPGSSETHKHTYSLKSLVEVHFTEEKGSDGTVSRVCPSCKKNLSNGLKAMRMFIPRFLIFDLYQLEEGEGEGEGEG